MAYEISEIKSLLLGWQSMWQLFTKKANIKGSVPFFLGLFLLFVRWPVAGIILELYGSFVLFRSSPTSNHFSNIHFLVDTDFCFYLAVVTGLLSKPSYIRFQSLDGFCNTPFSYLV
uniref:Uncharacterized protein n=1 Tax=Aegilops tauschii subsp. strangulata TaxID=200361 RepID=A0A453P0P7_AEGTS